MIVGVILFAVFMVLLFTPLRKMVFGGLRQVFSRRRQVRAVLVSKVDSVYEDKATKGLLMEDYGNVHKDKEAVRDSHWLGNGVHVKKLIFDVSGKDVEFDVNDELYSSLEEKSVGMLDYKGYKLYSFSDVQEAGDYLADGMGEADYSEWLARRSRHHKKSKLVRRLGIIMLLFAFFIVADILAVRGWNYEKWLQDNGHFITAEAFYNSLYEQSLSKGSDVYEFKISYGNYTSHHRINVSKTFYQNDGDTVKVYYETEPIEARPLYKTQVWMAIIGIWSALALAALAGGAYTGAKIRRLAGEEQ